jgi:tetratricopeptide (TPR) repeat protein
MHFMPNFSRCLPVLTLAAALLGAGCSAFRPSKEQYVQRGNEAMEKGEFGEAAINYRNALKADPNYGEAYYRYGLSLRQESKLPEAVTALEKAVDVQPDLEPARVALAGIYLDGLTYLPTPPKPLYDKLEKLIAGFVGAEGKAFHGNRLRGHLAMLDARPADAARHFQAALDARPADTEVATLLVQSLFEGGNPAAAIAAAEKSLAARPAQGALYDILYLHYRRQNQPQEAEQLLIRRAAANPADPIAVLQLARHYHSLRQPDRVEQVLARLTAPNSPFPDGLLTAADFHRQTGNPRRAIELYRQGSGSVYRKRLASVLIQTGEQKEAATLLDALHRAAPDDNEVAAARAALRAASGQPADIDGAIADFTRLVESDPKAPSYRYDLARALRLRGRDDEARRHLLKALEADANYLPALEELAALSLAQGRPQDAANYSGRALTLTPDQPGIRLISSAALAMLGKTSEARQEINATLRQYPGLPEAHLQLALLHVQERRFREADALYRQHYRPGQPDVRFLRGLVELGFASGQPERGLEALQQELRLQPGSVPVRMLMATTAARLNRYPLALEHFEWLRANTPPSLQVAMAIGVAHQQSGAWPAAVAAFAEARKLAPADPQVLASLAYATQQSGNPAGAVPLYREALQGNAAAPVVRNNLAMALVDSGGDLQEALQLARAAAAADPANPVFADALGLVYLKRKELPNATQSFRAAVARRPEEVSFRIHLAQALLASGDAAAAKDELAAASARRPSPEQQAEIRTLLAGR